MTARVTSFDLCRRLDFVGDALLKLLIVLGTRPEAIKLAPVALAARKHVDVQTMVCNTGQHADMCADVLDLFGISADVDLELMTPRQSLTDVTGSVLKAMHGVLEQNRPDWLVIQGDTTTAFSAALAAFYQKIPVAHVEAGLRTGDIYAPWPEEMNRKLITAITRLHFAPLPSNAENLRREGVEPTRVMVTGNTGIDALNWLVRRLDVDVNLRRRAHAALKKAGIPCLESKASRIVLITAHRRESFGAGFSAICAAIASLARRFPDHHFVYPVHPNPKVRETVFSELAQEHLANVHLIEPLDYLAFVLLMSQAELLLTDSGGIQEEAPSLGKRVIVMRKVTERTEGLLTSFVRLAGANADKIIADATDALCGHWSADQAGQALYGEGTAAEQIVAALSCAANSLS
jgi:UDP-N-acetylglucosamine 2-epimerase (non-hydrolysing)